MATPFCVMIECKRLLLQLRRGLLLKRQEYEVGMRSLWKCYVKGVSSSDEPNITRLSSSPQPLLSSYSSFFWFSRQCFISTCLTYSSVSRLSSMLFFTQSRQMFSTKKLITPLPPYTKQQKGVSYYLANLREYLAAEETCFSGAVGDQNLLK